MCNFLLLIYLVSCMIRGHSIWGLARDNHCSFMAHAFTSRSDQCSNVYDARELSLYTSFAFEHVSVRELLLTSVLAHIFE